MKICSQKSVLCCAFVVGMMTFNSPGIVSSTAYASGAGSCHFHGNKAADESTVIMCADKQKARLVDKGTIAPNWTAIKHTAIEQIDGKKGKEW